MPFVFEATMNSVFGSTGCFVETFRTPNPPSKTTLP